jgi:prepilin-type N-terminal cleavage/methylation domain-containing protein
MDMKSGFKSRFEGSMAFTLVELLTVIAIIGVLAGLLMSALVSAKNHAKVTVAKSDITTFKNAIMTYYTEYSRYPAGSNAYNCAAVGVPSPYDCPSFTFGTFATSFDPNFVVLNTNSAPLPAATYQTNNSEVVAILKGWQKLPNGFPSMNTNYVLNPHKNDFLGSPKLASDTNSPNIGIDGVFRDPWKRPYIVSMDLSFNKITRDVLYRNMAVSQSAAGSPTGLSGLANYMNLALFPNNFDYTGGVMVWSAGLDGAIDYASRADSGANKDNIVSW